MIRYLVAMILSINFDKSWASSEPTLQLGAPAPALATNLQWTHKRLETSSLSGKILIVKFWASWCGPCVHGMPKLDEIVKQHRTEDIRAIAIAAKEKDADAYLGLSKFIDENFGETAISFANDTSGQMWANWMVSAGERNLPTIFIVGRDGRLLFIGSESELTKVIPGILDGTWESSGRMNAFNDIRTRVYAQHVQRDAEREQFSLYEESGQWDKALAMADAAIADHPLALTMWPAKIRLLRKAGRYDLMLDAAEDIYDRIIIAGSDDPSIWSRIKRIRMDQHKFKAVLDLRRNVRLIVYGAMLDNHLAELYPERPIHLNDLSETQRVRRRAIGQKIVDRIWKRIEFSDWRPKELVNNPIQTRWRYFETLARFYHVEKQTQTAVNLLEYLINHSDQVSQDERGRKNQIRRLAETIATYTGSPYCVGDLCAMPEVIVDSGLQTCTPVLTKSESK